MVDFQDREGKIWLPCACNRVGNVASSKGSPSVGEGKGGYNHGKYASGLTIARAWWVK